MESPTGQSSTKTPKGTPVLLEINVVHLCVITLFRLTRLTLVFYIYFTLTNQTLYSSLVCTTSLKINPQDNLIFLRQFNYRLSQTTIILILISETRLDIGNYYVILNDVIFGQLLSIWLYRNAFSHTHLMHNRRYKIIVRC